MSRDAEFTIKDSGARAEFSGGMVRDTEEGKDDWSNLRIGPMPRRIVRHLTLGREKYPDPAPGIPNWTLGRGLEVWLRARASFGRHQDAWLAGKTDEDHAAGIYFNMNLAEYVRQFFSEEEELQALRVERLQSENVPAPGQAEREHVTDGGECWCDPRVEIVNAPFSGTPVPEHVFDGGMDDQAERLLTKGRKLIRDTRTPAFGETPMGPQVGTTGPAKGDFA